MKLNRGFLLILISLIAAGAASSLSAKSVLVKNHKAKSRIVCNKDDSYSVEAALLLNKMLEEMTGDTLELVDHAGKGSGYVFIGERTDKARHDGFEIIVADGNVHIKTAGGKGSIYGVSELLERGLGVDYLSYGYFMLDKSADAVLDDMHIVETPAFRYRQTQGYPLSDPDYYNWMRLAQPSDVFIDGLWVHTMDWILPAKKYGKSHPEYYSFINGERRPGNHSQWCLTNEAVFEAACKVLDSIFAANPDKSLISVSQNDGNFTNCHCEACAALEEYEGAPSGPIIHFMNKLAAKYPDKEFSTLAYLFSMQAPKHVKPLPNVNIMLCDIDCKREVPLTDNASGRDFVRAISDWSKISNNIFVWDYGINFDNYLSPFPNFHIIQPNIQLFRDHHANMVFEQIGGPEGCDMAELRAYLMSKLMWNPDLDLDATIRHFLDKYYGAAAGEMYRYLLLRQGGLLASNKDLWIYDSPVTHKDGMLNPNMLKEYNKLFDAAEKAVEGDSARLAHVQMARLTVMYSDLEISRANGGGDPEELRAKVEKFRELTGKYNVPSLNERTNSPSEYCDLYLSRFLPDENVVNKAKGAKVTYTKPPKQGYMKIADKALTDGIYGGTTYVESWVGWEGTDADFTIDLGSETEINEVTTDFLHQLGAWILEPKAVTWLVSDDNENFREIGRHEFVEDRDVAVKFNTVKTDLASPVKARYLRVKVDGIGLCPDWHYGVGHPAWFFIDEVTVK